MELTPHISDQDLHLLPLALNTVVSVLRTNPASLDPVNNDILPSIFQLVQSTLVQGAALDSLLVLFRTLIETDDDHFNKLLDGLLSPVQKNQDLNQLTLSKQVGLFICVPWHNYNNHLSSF